MTSDLEALSHPDRQRAVAALGRRAGAGDADAARSIAALANDPEPWRRWLAALAHRAARNVGALRAATLDPSQWVRSRAWSGLIALGADEQIASAILGIQDTRLAPKLARLALRRRSLPAVEGLVAGLAGPDRPDWLDALPACSEERVPLPLIDEHGSPAAWVRMARSHPRPRGISSPRSRKASTPGCCGASTPSSRGWWTPTPTLRWTSSRRCSPSKARRTRSARRSGGSRRSGRNAPST